MRKTCMAVLIALAAAHYGVSAAYWLGLTQKCAVEGEVLAAVAERDSAFVAGAVSHVQDKATWLKECFEPIAPRIKSGEFHWRSSERQTFRCVTSVT